MEHDWFKVRLPSRPCGSVSNESVFRAENMLSTLEMIRKEFGGVENYMIEKCGLTKEQVERIRSNLIVEQPAIHTQVTHNL